MEADFADIAKFNLSRYTLYIYIYHVSVWFFIFHSTGEVPKMNATLQNIYLYREKYAFPNPPSAAKRRLESWQSRDLPGSFEKTVAMKT